MKTKRIYSLSRIVALAVIGVMLLGLTYLGMASATPQSRSAGGARWPVDHAPVHLRDRERRLPRRLRNAHRARGPGKPPVTPDRAAVTRILARSSHPLAPIFHLNGGPGITNMTFPQADRLAADHDVVMLGYRGVDGSSVLNCPEVTAALENTKDYLAKASLTAYSKAFATCAKRLERSGVEPRRIHAGGAGQRHRGRSRRARLPAHRPDQR